MINSYVDLDEHATVEEKKKYLIKPIENLMMTFTNAKVCTVQVFVEFYKMFLVVIAVAVGFDLVYTRQGGERRLVCSSRISYLELDLDYM